MSLEQALEEFGDDYRLFMACELECYLDSNCDESVLDKIITNIPLDYLWKKEESEGQYEFVSARTTDIISLAESVAFLQSQTQLNTEAKPFADRAGSGLHVHISIWQGDKNLFAKGEEEESEYMQYAIAALLEHLPKSMPIFAPKKESYKRFKEDKHTPRTISWGGNNRSVAIRIPSSTADPELRHIEHRIPGADVDVFQVFTTIINTLNYAITSKPKLTSAKIYGEAGDAQYQLPLLPLSLEEAKKYS